jgi:hypothetical protein
MQWVLVQNGHFGVSGSCLPNVAAGVAQLQQLRLTRLLLEQHAEHHPPPQQQ